MRTRFARPLSLSFSIITQQVSNIRSHLQPPALMILAAATQGPPFPLRGRPTRDRVVPKVEAEKHLPKGGVLHLNVSSWYEAVCITRSIHPSNVLWENVCNQSALATIFKYSFFCTPRLAELLNRNLLRQVVGKYVPSSCIYILHTSNLKGLGTGYCPFHEP